MKLLKWNINRRAGFCALLLVFIAVPAFSLILPSRSPHLNQYASGKSLFPNKPFVVTKNHPRVTIALQNNVTTGYAWFIRKYNPYLIVPINAKYGRPKKNLVGAPGERRFTFEVNQVAFKAPHEILVTFVYRRHWYHNAGTSHDVVILTRP